MTARKQLIAAIRNLVQAEITEAVVKRLDATEQHRKEIEQLRAAATEGMETALVNYEVQLQKLIGK